MLAAWTGQGWSAGGAPARDVGRRQRGRAAGRGGPLHIERGGGRRSGRNDRGELGHALDVAEGVLAPPGQWSRIGDTLGDGGEQSDRGVGARRRVPDRPVNGVARPQLPAGLACRQFGFRIEVAGDEFQAGQSVRDLDGERTPARAVDLPALFQQGHDGKEGIVVVAPRDWPGEVGGRPLFVCRGEGRGERGNELGGDAIVEADAPGRRPERIAVGGDAPEPVVLAFGEVAQADLAVGSVDVDVADYVESDLSRFADRMERTSTSARSSFQESLVSASSISCLLIPKK